MTGGELKIEVLPAGRRGAGVRPARRGLQGHARRWARRAGLSLRQAERARAVGLGAGVRHGRQHAARVAPVRRRQGAAAKALRVDRRQRGLVPLRADADAAARLVQEADHQERRFQGPQVPHGRHFDRRVHRARRRRQPAARRRNRAGHGPRADRRGGVQQRLVGSRAWVRRRLQGVHAAKLPPECRAVRDHVQQGQVRRAAREDARHHRQCGRCGVRRHGVEGDRSLLQGLHRVAEREATSSSTRHRTRCCKASSPPTTPSPPRSPPRTRSSRRSKRRRRRSRRAPSSGSSIPTSTGEWRSTIISGRGSRRRNRRTAPRSAPLRGQGRRE